MMEMEGKKVMLVGITFNRERQNMTQKELGIGICSGTHVSKNGRVLRDNLNISNIS
jgi:hypothetical protein